MEDDIQVDSRDRGRNDRNTCVCGRSTMCTRLGEKSASHEEADWTSSTGLTDGGVYGMRTLSRHWGRDEGGVCVEQAPWFDDKGGNNDSNLLHQCDKHLRAVLTKRSLIQELKTNFWSQKRGAFLFGGRFSQTLGFEAKAANFVHRAVDDSFVVDEARQLSVVMEDAFYGSQYWSHFEPICAKIKEACS